MRQVWPRVNLDLCASIQIRCWLAVLCLEIRPNGKPENVSFHAYFDKNI